MNDNGPTRSKIPGVEVRRLPGHSDDRGLFRETFRQAWFAGAPPFVQGNASASQPGVLRGLHYHLAQDDFWVLLQGRVTAGLADIRSSQRRLVETVELTSGDGLYVPRGVAHGFYAHDDVLLLYYVTNYYDGDDEHGIAWNDPDLALPWPCTAPILSPRDRDNPRLRDIRPSLLPP